MSACLYVCMSVCLSVKIILMCACGHCSTLLLDVGRLVEWFARNERNLIRANTEANRLNLLSLQM